MRVPRMRPDGHNRRRIGDHAVGAKLAEDPLLQVELGERFSGSHASRRLGKSGLCDCVDHAASGAMRIELFGSPCRLELLDEIRRANHFATLRAYQLDRACIHQ